METIYNPDSLISDASNHNQCMCCKNPLAKVIEKREYRLDECATCLYTNRECLMVDSKKCYCDIKYKNVLIVSCKYCLSNSCKFCDNLGNSIKCSSCRNSKCLVCLLKI